MVLQDREIEGGTVQVILLPMHQEVAEALERWEEMVVHIWVEMVAMALPGLTEILMLVAAVLE
jgi:hypothetical protein